MARHARVGYGWPPVGRLFVGFSISSYEGLLAMTAPASARATTDVDLLALTLTQPMGGIRQCVTRR